MLVRRGNLKNSAASGKAKSLLLTIARTQRQMRKARWRCLFNDSCSLNISGSDEEQARRVLEEYIQVRFIDSDSVQPTQAELTAHPLPRSLSRLNPDLLYGRYSADCRCTVCKHHQG